MRKELLALTILGQSLSLPAQLTNAGANDIVVAIPPELQASSLRTEEESQRHELYKKIKKNMPYKGDLSKTSSPLGALCKVSDAIIIGHVVQPEVSGSNQNSTKFTIKSDTNIFGKVSGSSVSVEVLGHSGLCKLNGGERVIAFLSRNAARLFEASKWEFNAPPVEENVLENLRLRGDGRGIIIINSAEEEKAYLDSVAGYIRYLRKENKDFEKYYQFLCGQMKSPYFRIKEDARRDMLDLIKSYPSIDLDRVLKDDNVDNGIKDYVRLILKPWKENKKVP